MKLFVSQPMRGKTDEEIIEERNAIIACVSEAYPDEFIEVLDTFFGTSDMSHALEYLGESIKMLAQADYAVFTPDFADYRGCWIEYECAIRYGIKTILLEDGDEE